MPRTLAYSKLTLDRPENSVKHVYNRDTKIALLMTTVSAFLSERGDNFQFWKGGCRKKMSTSGELKNFCHIYLPGGTYYVLCQKRLCKIKYGSEGSTSIVDLSLF